MSKTADKAREGIRNNSWHSQATRWNKTPRPPTASQLAKRYGLEPTTIANLKASQARLKAMGRDLTLEQVYALEFNQAARES